MTENPGYLTIPGSHGVTLMYQEEREAILDSIGDDQNVCEVGTYHGATARYWASQRPKSRFLSVDDFSLTGEFPPEECATYCMRNRLPNLNFFLGKFTDLEPFVRPTSFHLIFEDGNHSLRGCLENFALASELLVPGGTLVVHDYKREPVPEVTEAVHQFCAADGWQIVKIVAYAVWLKRNGDLPCDT